MRALTTFIAALALGGALHQAGCAARPTASRSEGTEVERAERDEPANAVPPADTVGRDGESEEKRDEPGEPVPCDT